MIYTHTQHWLMFVALILNMIVFTELVIYYHMLRRQIREREWLYDDLDKIMDNGEIGFWA